jgi:hypothetical protein
MQIGNRTQQTPGPIQTLHHGCHKEED